MLKRPHIHLAVGFHFRYMQRSMGAEFYEEELSFNKARYPCACDTCRGMYCSTTNIAQLNQHTQYPLCKAHHSHSNRRCRCALGVKYLRLLSVCGAAVPDRRAFPHRRRRRRSDGHGHAAILSPSRPGHPHRYALR